MISDLNPEGEKFLDRQLTGVRKEQVINVLRENLLIQEE
jgi:hypothetical protein